MNMKNDFYVVTGATGNIGSKTVRKLLSAGKRVRAVARNESKLKSLKDIGAEPFIGDIGKTEDLVKAFSGATAAFLMIPPHYAAPDMRAYQNHVGEAQADAITKTNIGHIVNLSSFGAHLREKIGPILGLRDQEERLNSLTGPRIIHLRPAYFMENLLMFVSLIKNMQIAGSTLQPDVATPMIATRDIADAVTDHLLKLDFSHKSHRELLGPRDITMLEATRTLGRSIGRPDLAYVQFPYADAEKAMVQMGLSPDAAHQLVDLQQSINDGILKPQEARSSQNTTPTTIEEFAAEVFAPAFEPGKAAATA